LKHIVDRLRNRTAAFVHDLVMIPAAWFAAYWLRFNLETVPHPILLQSIRMLPVVVAVQGAVFWYLGLYRGLWRFASLPDLVRIVNSVIVGVALSAVGIFLLTRMQHVPRSVLPLFALLLVACLGGPRLLYRWLKEGAVRRAASTRVLVAGAGAAGEQLVRDMLHDRTLGWRPVAFVDDASESRGREIHGVRVVAKCGRIPEVVRELGVELVVIAIPGADSRGMRRLVGLCESAGVPVRTLPGRGRMTLRQGTLSQVREVAIEDLLGRESVRLGREAIDASVRGKVVLVSGGGGSIGSELLRQLAPFEPRRLVIVDQSEFNLYRIERELRDAFPDLDVRPHLIDVCDEAALTRCFELQRPSSVFHAAAYKHVPMLEGQVRAAAMNNVIGTYRVARAAARHDSERFVLVSTDKAVNPTNIMGTTKRIADLLCQNLDFVFPRTRFVTVRFGNVLDSAGSVAPRFRDQIARGGPVTVTHPEVTRYFMTIPEAGQLILQAGAIGAGGEIFVLDMGEPIKIRYLAEQMIRLAGQRPGEDIEIVYSGLRPGEKLFEELFYVDEALRPTGSEKLLLARSRRISWDVLERHLRQIEVACAGYDEAALRHVMTALVPEYRPRASPGASNVVPLPSIGRREESVST